MKQLLQARGGPATALGIVAVILAAGGGAYAATDGGTITACVHHNGGGLYRAHRCAPKDRELRWNVKGPPGQRGKPGARGLQGPAGSALAYAHVVWDGTSAAFDAANTKGMGTATVTKVNTAEFCFSGLPFTPHNANVTIDLKDGDYNLTGQVEIDPLGKPANACGAGETVKVLTDDPFDNVLVPVSFYITFN